MKYRCGMYGGSFNPLHIGHVRCIIRAANMCERLIIVISNGRKRCEAISVCATGGCTSLLATCPM